MIIGIDFDGTIVVDKWPEIGELMPGVKEVINKLDHAGHRILINSCRVGKEEGDIETFLQDNFIKYEYINCNLPENIIKYGKDCRKISADVYIDDKNLGGFPGWDHVERMLLNGL